MSRSGKDAEPRFDSAAFERPVELIGPAELDARVREIAQSIDAQFGRAVGAPREGAQSGRPGSVLTIGVLTGAYVFLADLSRRMRTPHEVAFVSAASYGDRGHIPNEKVTIAGLDGLEVGGRHVVIVEDLIDTGHTLSDLETNVRERGAASVTTCVLVVKQRARAYDIKPDLVGFELPDVFIVGYGIDYRGAWRQLPYIGYVEVPR